MDTDDAESVLCDHEEDDRTTDTTSLDTSVNHDESDDTSSVSDSKVNGPTLDISYDIASRLCTFLSVVNKLSTLPDHDRVFGVELGGVLTEFLGD